MKNLLGAMALVAAVGVASPEAKAQSYILNTYIGSSAFFITVSNTGSYVWFETDVGDPNFDLYWQSFHLWDTDQKPLDIFFHCCGTNGVNHIDAVESLTP